MPYYDFDLIANIEEIPSAEGFERCDEFPCTSFGSESIPLTSITSTVEDRICFINNRFDFSEGPVCSDDLFDENELCHSEYAMYCFNFDFHPIEYCDNVVSIRDYVLDFSVLRNCTDDFYVFINNETYLNPDEDTYYFPNQVESICIVLNEKNATCNTCLEQVSQRVTYNCECHIISIPNPEGTNGPILNIDEQCECDPIDPVAFPPCVSELPECTDKEEQDQETYIKGLLDWAANLSLGDVAFPIEMCRTTLCDGRIINIPTQYLAENPFPGPIDCTIFQSPLEPPSKCIINNPELLAMKFSYHSPNGGYSGATPQYNGNISQIEQQIMGKYIEGLNYQYDALDRLKEQNYWWKSCDNRYWNNRFYNVEGIEYDLNGNMESIKRYTRTPDMCDPDLGIIDDLGMAYSGNQLMSVTEASTFEPELGYILGENTGGYSYDPNGNMIEIGNKSFSLVYNFLNLPGGKIYGPGGVSDDSWTYSADGSKLKSDGREYVDGIEYENGELYALHHAEGRLFPKLQTEEEIQQNGPLEWRHQFYLRDHLGNTRVVVDNVGLPIQENNYYPFGMNMENVDIIPDNGIRDTRFTYNGKEMNEDLGWLDYGFRFYDPSICRFSGVDPIAEYYPHVSSYNYAENEPVRHIDLWGLQKFDPITGQTGPFSTAHIQEQEEVFTTEQIKRTTVTQEIEGDKSRLNEALFETGKLITNVLEVALLAEGMPEARVVSSLSKTVSTGAKEVAEGAVNLESRANAVHGAVPKATQNRTTIAAGLADDGTVIIGSSEKNLRRAQRAALKPGEVAASGVGHAEVTVINHARSMGLNVKNVAASRPICQNCQTFLKNNNVSPASPLKAAKKVKQ